MQPLCVIKKAVEGKWRVMYYGYGLFMNTFVNITKDSVIITQNEDLDRPFPYLGRFSYTWKHEE
jgi:hypothetical protein